MTMVVMVCRIIVERFLPAWWSDLDVTLCTDKHLDTKTIHRFDPPAAHMGGKGKAGPYLGSGLPAGQGELKKQVREEVEEDYGWRGRRLSK